MSDAPSPHPRDCKASGVLWRKSSTRVPQSGRPLCSAVPHRKCLRRQGGETPLTPGRRGTLGLSSWSRAGKDAVCDTAIGRSASDHQPLELGGELAARQEAVLRSPARGLGHERIPVRRNRRVELARTRPVRLRGLGEISTWFWPSNGRLPVIASNRQAARPWVSQAGVRFPAPAGPPAPGTGIPPCRAARG